MIRSSTDYSPSWSGLGAQSHRFPHRVATFTRRYPESIRSIHAFMRSCFHTIRASLAAFSHSSAVNPSESFSIFGDSCIRSRVAIMLVVPFSVGMALVFSQISFHPELRSQIHPISQSNADRPLGELSSKSRPLIHLRNLRNLASYPLWRVFRLA